MKAVLITISSLIFSTLSFASITVNIDGQIYRCSNGPGSGTAKFCKCESHPNPDADGILSLVEMNLETGYERYIRDLGRYSSVDSCYRAARHNPACNQR